jgi:hypothetical protein
MIMLNPDYSQMKSCEDAAALIPGFDAFQELACEILSLGNGDIECVSVPGDGTLVVETNIGIQTIEEHSG